MMMNEQQNTMKQIIYQFLTENMNRETAVEELMEIGFTQLEAKFELTQWELK